MAYLLLLMWIQVVHFRVCLYRMAYVLLLMWIQVVHFRVCLYRRAYVLLLMWIQVVHIRVCLYGVAYLLSNKQHPAAEGHALTNPIVSHSLVHHALGSNVCKTRGNKKKQKAR
jgi:hypothetical protein